MRRSRPRPLRQRCCRKCSQQRLHPRQPGWSCAVRTGRGSEGHQFAAGHRPAWQSNAHAARRRTAVTRRRPELLPQLSELAGPCLSGRRLAVRQSGLGDRVGNQLRRIYRAVRPAGARARARWRGALGSLSDLRQFRHAEVRRQVCTAAPAGPRCHLGPGIPCAQSGRGRQRRESVRA